MSDHPYAGSQTLTPGETADDDPHGRKEFCSECDDYVRPIDEVGTCPTCGSEVV